MVSDILWPGVGRPPGCTCPLNDDQKAANQQAVARARVARKTLGVKGEQPPELNRRVRNAFAHLDKRIDLFLARNTMFIDQVIGPAEQMPAFDTKQILRWFDQTSTDVSVLGDSINLIALTNTLDDLAVKAQQWLDENPDAQIGVLGTGTAQ
jgi:hypothetical protein